MEKKGYNIEHSGAQKVKAPLSTGAKKGKSTVKSGEDLRGGKK